MLRFQSNSQPGQAIERSTARQEWSRLCYVLEGLQATALLQRTADKHTMARTYRLYHEDYTTAASAIIQAVAAGDYRFFTNRGVATSQMTLAFARDLLRDWQGAIASKQARIAEAFQRRFGEDIDEFLATPRYAEKIAVAVNHDQGNAVMLLERWLPNATL